MARTKHIILIFALVLLSTQGAISEEAQLSNTRQAICILKINSTTDTLPYLEPGEMAAIIKSPSVLGKTIRDILEISPDEILGLLDNIRVSGQIVDDKYTCSTELMIALPDTVKPAAIEFLKALAENLQNSLNNAYDLQRGKIYEQYEVAENKFKRAELDIQRLIEEPVIRIYPTEESNIDFDTKRQLEKRVDLSNLDLPMSFEEVLNEISNSVEPPLQIQPNWRDLADLPDIQPTTPAEMGPLTNVKISAAIETLLSGLSTPDVPLGYAIQDKIIIIATEETLPINLETTVYDISGLLVNGRTSNTLIRAIKETIEPETWFDITPEGEGQIIDMQGGKLSIINTPEVQYKITDFLTNFPKEIPSESVEAIPANILFEEQQKLSSQKRMVELEVARLEARREAAEQQIISLSGKMKTEESLDELIRKRSVLSNNLEELKQTLSDKHPEVIAVQKRLGEVAKQVASLQDDTITSELLQLINKQTQQFRDIRTEVNTGRAHSSELAAIEEKLARLNIDLARRREELSRPVGIENLSALNENLSMTILDLAEKKAEYQVLERQLGEIESQIKATTTTDPKVLKYRETKKAFEEAGKRLNELKEIKDNMQPPQVIAIGLD